jgi:hypothetical protein
MTYATKTKSFAKRNPLATELWSAKYKQRTIAKKNAIAIENKHRNRFIQKMLAGG